MLVRTAQQTTTNVATNGFDDYYHPVRDIPQPKKQSKPGKYWLQFDREAKKRFR